MKRMAIAVALIVIMLGTSCLCLKTLTDIKDEFTAKFDELSALVEAGEQEAAVEAAGRLTDEWMDKHHVLCRIVRHTQLDQVTLSVARLEPLARHGENGELAAEIRRCKILLEDIWDSELPYFRNIA